MKEDTIVQRTLKVLSQYFNIRREVWSQDHKSRIDAIVQCKTSNIHLGLEFKHDNKKTGKDIGHLTKQAMIYSHKKFDLIDRFEIVPVFVAPPISIEILICPDGYIMHEGIKYYRDRHQEDHIHHTVNGWLGALNIGELRSIRHTDKARDYFIFVMSNQIIWSSKKRYMSNQPVGLHLENYNKLMQRLRDDNGI